MIYDVRDHLTDDACWQIADGRFPRFCAELANGRKRCAKGTCYVRDVVARRGGSASRSADNQGTMGTDPPPW